MLIAFAIASLLVLALFIAMAAIVNRLLKRRAINGAAWFLIPLAVGFVWTLHGSSPGLELAIFLTYFPAAFVGSFVAMWFHLAGFVRRHQPT